MKRRNVGHLNILLLLLFIGAAIVVYLLALNLQDVLQDPPPPPSSPPNILETLEADERFTTLLTAVRAAGLEDALRGSDILTGFCPTNAAFEKLANDSKVDLETLLVDRELLTKILTDHVAAGNMSLADLSQQSRVTTLQGTSVDLVMDGDTLKVDNATIIEADIEASNGVVHVIDTVLLPVAPFEPPPPVDLEPATEVWQPYTRLQPLPAEIASAELVPGHPLMHNAVQELSEVLSRFNVHINTARTVRLGQDGEITYVAPVSSAPQRTADGRVLGVLVIQGEASFFAGPGPHVVLALDEDNDSSEFDVGFMDSNFEIVATRKAALHEGGTIDDIPGAAILYGTRWCKVWNFCWPCGGFGSFDTRNACFDDS